MYLWQSRATPCWFAPPLESATMTSAREHDPTPDEPQPITPAAPSDWVKPVELIELLQRRTEKRKQATAPTSSPFYDAEFVATHPRKRKRRSD